MPTRYGILGCGAIVRREHLPALARLPDAHVVALADPDPAALAASQALLPAPVPTAPDLDGLLEHAPDAVLIASPNDAHEAQALAALAAGAHVFLEKPMAVTPAGARRVRDAALASGRALQVGYVFRYSYLFRAAAKLLQAGAIGTPVDAWCHEWRQPMPKPWRYSKARTGGMFVEKNCHHIDLFQWFLNEGVSWAAATGQQRVLRAGADVVDILGDSWTLPESDIPDHASALFGFESGASARLMVTFFAPFRHRLEVGVTGTGGVLVVHEDEGRIEIHDGKGRKGVRPERYEEEEEPVHSGSVQQHREFLEAVAGRREVVCDAVMGYEGVLPAFMAERAMGRRRVVRREEIER